MKTFLTAAVLAVCALPAFAQTTFDVHKARGSFAGFIKDTSGPVPVLIAYKLTTNQIINLARGRGLKEKVPANEVLAGAADFDKIFAGDPTAPRRLIVWNTTTAASLGTIMLADTATVKAAENHFSAKGGFRRVGFGEGIVQAIGTPTNGFNSGVLQVNSVFKRTIAPATSPRPATPSVSQTMFGVISLNDGGVLKEYFVTKGLVAVSGKRIGQFTE